MLPKLTTLIITDSFAPESSAAAIMMTQLTSKILSLGCSTVVGTSVENKIEITDSDKLRLFQVKNKFKRSNKYYRRVIGEIIASIWLGLKLRLGLISADLENIIVYSPSIFWFLTIKLVNSKSSRKILILRDLFPLWLLKAGVLHGERFPYKFLNYFARLQYDAFDRIYVQSQIDVETLVNKYLISENKIQVLENWQDEIIEDNVPDLDNHICKSRKNLLWLGNLGVAQNQKFVISVLIEFVKANKDVKINFVGLKPHDKQKILSNFPDLLSDDSFSFIERLDNNQCAQLAYKSDLGLLSLNHLERDGNIPGKFISYMMTGLPTFALCGKDSAVGNKIANNNLGFVETGLDHGTCARALSIAIRKNLDRAKIKNFFLANHKTEIALARIMQLER